MRDNAYLLGLVGTGTTPSLTPPLHMAEARAQGLDCIYRPIDLTVLGLDADRLPDILDWAERLGFERGFWEGMLEPGSAVALASVVFIGAGGAGSAVADALMRLGVARLSIVDVDRSAADALAADLRARHPEADARASDPAPLPELLAAADGLVHCTPIGMHDHPGLPVDPALLRPELWVADIVYRPLETALTAAARARGCRVLTGGAMAVGQAVDAFRLFTGREADADRMHTHFQQLVRAASTETRPVSAEEHDE